MKEVNTPHELSIQRLIDNELNEQQRVSFLQVADGSPELWRSIALAFVEDRVWSSVVSESSNIEATSQRVNHSSRAVINENGVGTERTATRRNKPWWLQYGPQLMMTAAAALFVFSLALRFNPVRSDSNPSNAIAERTGGSDPMTPQEIENGEQKLNPKGMVPDGSQFVSGPYRLKVGDDVEVPLFDNLDRWREEQKRLPQLNSALQERLMKAGLQIQPNTQFFTGYAPDGRSIVVPVQRYQVRRIGQ